MTIKRAVTIICTLALVCAGDSVAQQYGKKELRRHYAITDQASGLAYRVTEIVQIPNDSQNLDIYLVEDVGGTG